jgi:hypothetical protein
MINQSMTCAETCRDARDARMHSRRHADTHALRGGRAESRDTAAVVWLAERYAN